MFNFIDPINFETKKDTDKIVKELNSEFKKIKIIYKELGIFEQAKCVSLFLAKLYNIKPFFELISRVTDYTPIKDKVNIVDELIKKTYLLMDKSYQPILVMNSLTKDMEDKMSYLDEELEKILNSK